jgi:hypothetical protein
VSALEAAAKTIATNNDSTAQTELNSAIKAFDTAILDTTGLFGPQGPVIQVNSEHGYIPVNLTVNRDSTTLGSVSGTATAGKATLTATLTTSSGGIAVSGATISFTLDGAFAGTALTDASGVATLTNVATTDATGTVTGAVAASFAGNLQNKPSEGSGDLVVS